MNDQFRQFYRRVGRIDQAYANRIPNAFTIRSDGLVVPKTRSRLRFEFPWRALLAGFFCAVMLKGFLIWYLGVDLYTARLETMLTGAQYEQIAAHILLPDRVSLWVSEQFAVFVASVRY